MQRLRFSIFCFRSFTDSDSYECTVNGLVFYVHVHHLDGIVVNHEVNYVTVPHKLSIPDYVVKSAVDLILRGYSK